jgi:hypothetical protein
MHLFLKKTALQHAVGPAVKPTTCTSFSNYLFCIAPYMFRTVFPSIIRSSELYIQQQAYVKQVLLSACWRERDGNAVSSR